MLINDIDYYVGIYILGEDDFPEYEAHFTDFQALNVFIRENINNPKYVNNKMGYSLVEAIDGEPDAYSWVQNMRWQEFSNEQIQQEIDDFIEYEKENQEENIRIEQFSKEIHYFDDGEDYHKKQEHLKDIAYVCPRCIREVDDCRCAHYPWYLVQIDKLMVPIIRELNSKGYRTTSCCAGHLDEESKGGSGIYISFAENYEFDEAFPEGGKYSFSKQSLHYQVPENCEDFLEYQRNILWQLEDWAELLSETDFWDLDNDEADNA